MNQQHNFKCPLDGIFRTSDYLEIFGGENVKVRAVCPNCSKECTTNLVKRPKKQLYGTPNNSSPASNDHIITINKFPNAVEHKKEQLFLSNLDVGLRNGLNSSEAHVLSLWMDGSTQGAIARANKITQAYVCLLLGRIRRKLGVKYGTGSSWMARKYIVDLGLGFRDLNTPLLKTAATIKKDLIIPELKKEYEDFIQTEKGEGGVVL